MRFIQIKDHEWCSPRTPIASILKYLIAMKIDLAEMPSQLNISPAVWVACSLLLLAIIARQFLSSKHNKAFLRLDGPANASWLLGTSRHLLYLCS
jgi:hypothetical protein